MSVFLAFHLHPKHKTSNKTYISMPLAACRKSPDKSCFYIPAHAHAACHFQNLTDTNQYNIQVNNIASILFIVACLSIRLTIHIGHMLYTKLAH